MMGHRLDKQLKALAGRRRLLTGLFAAIPLYGALDGRGGAVRRLLLALLLFLVGFSAPCLAAGTPDPCNSLTSKASVVVNQSSATTTQLVALNATHAIYICSFTMTIAGSTSSASSAQFEYGTGTNCSSVGATLTGAFGSGDAALSPNGLTVAYGDGGYSIMVVPPGSALCVVTAGGTVKTQGAVTYIQGTGNTFP